MTFDRWLERFQSNTSRLAVVDASIGWEHPSPLSPRDRAAFVRSFQRFELGESGDGERLLVKAAAAGDPAYRAALELLVSEEQGHSALFRRGLDHLGATTLRAHWSDAAFTALRRSLGLRTELGMFLIAETVAMGYFVALARDAPDPVLRAIGRQIATDERDHIRFQIDRLLVGFGTTPIVARRMVWLAWAVIATGAASVVIIDHGAALRACGVSRGAYWGRALRQFRWAARQVFTGSSDAMIGPAPRA